MLRAAGKANAADLAAAAKAEFEAEFERIPQTAPRKSHEFRYELDF